MGHLQSWWEEQHIYGGAGYVFHKKLKGLKTKIKEWIRDNTDLVERKIQAIENLVSAYDLEEEARYLSEDEVREKNALQCELSDCLRKEEILWSTKSREAWRSQGDQCSAYFHKLVNAKSISSDITHIMVEGNKVTDRDSIVFQIEQFYQALYREPILDRPVLDKISLKRLDDTAAYELESVFLEDEILKAVHDLEDERTPGPDGFPMKFFKICWPFIKKDVLKIFDDLFYNGYLDWRNNTTFLALIPKVEGDKSVSDFRPISLLSGMYKWIAKVLANRLKPKLNFLISELQGAACEGRQIQDLSLLANELLDSKVMSKHAGFLFKLDFYKAFDTVNWNFLCDILHRFGFGDRWISWLRVCWETASFSLLINGSAGKSFRASRGLRQGDPLSPLLFVLAAEVLTSFLLSAQTLGLIHGFSVSKDGEGIPILQFADDTLIMVEGNLGEAKMVRNLLIWFECFTGLHINAQKTAVYGVNFTGDWSDIVKFWGCQIGSLPGTYLGLPLGGRFKCVSSWDQIVNKFRVRLALWKRHFLSKGGRLILIKSTLCNVPVYMLSSRLMPVTVIAALEKIVRLFLWGTKAGQKKINLVAWEGVCLPMSMGGLGLKRLREINVSLLCKWFWRMSENSLWVRIIKEKYGVSPDGYFPNFGKKTIGGSIWRGLSKVCSLFKLLTRVVGDDAKLIWHDGKDNFSVRECYWRTLQLRVLFYNHGVFKWQWEKIWINTVPSKICFLLWLAIRDRVLTMENLKTRGFSLAARCTLCKCDTENMEHLFFSCSFASKVWNYFGWQDSQKATLSLSGRDRIANWANFDVTSRGKRIWPLLPHAILWSLWSERNARIFDDTCRSVDEVVVQIKGLIWNWVRGDPTMRDFRFENLVFDWDTIVYS